MKKQWYDTSRQKPLLWMFNLGTLEARKYLQMVLLFFQKNHSHGSIKSYIMIKLEKKRTRMSFADNYFKWYIFDSIKLYVRTFFGNYFNCCPWKFKIHIHQSIRSYHKSVQKIWARPVRLLVKFSSFQSTDKIMLRKFSRICSLKSS